MRSTASCSLGVSARLVSADIMIKTGRLDADRDALDAIRGDLYELRKASGVVVLADCIRDANAMMDALIVYNNRALDWDNSDTRSSLALKAVNYAAGLDRCDGIASEGVRDVPGVRRLIHRGNDSL